MERVPVIDMKPWYAGGAEERADFAGRVDSACRRWGFFQIVGHGISAALLERCHADMKTFFALPSEAKLAVSRSERSPWGYYDRELTKNVRDWKEVFDFRQHENPESPEPRPDDSRGEGVNQWPAELPDFRAGMLEYSAACESVAFDLLEAICRGLGLPPDRLEPAFRPQHMSFLRLNHYPPHDEFKGGDPTSEPTEGVQAGKYFGFTWRGLRGQSFGLPGKAPREWRGLLSRRPLGVNRHSDAGAITVLSQSDVASLQVYRAGAWSLVEPIPGALVINVGDMLQVWTNDRYEAPLHRVLANTKIERFSAPYFFNPAYETDCTPLDELIDDTHPPRYTTVNWGDFRRKRAAGDYADLGEEVQITQYRIGAG